MQRLKQSQSVAARRRIIIRAFDSTTHLPKTGVTIASTDLMIGKNGAAEAAFAGTWTEIASGLYSYEATAAELNTLGSITFRINKSGCDPNVKEAQVTTQDDYGNYDCNVTMINGSSAAAVIWRKLYESCPSGTVETTPDIPTNTGGVCVFKAVMAAGGPQGTPPANTWNEQTADHMNGRSIVYAPGSPLHGSAHQITDYSWDAVNSLAVFTTGQQQELPVDGAEFIVV